MTQQISTGPGDQQIAGDVERIEQDEKRLATDVDKLEHDLEVRRDEVKIFVNNSPVNVRHREVTGLKIKEAAIAQGVDIELDFQLWRLEGPHKRVQITDDETTQIHDEERFAANAPDDNS
jgi:hypothetical protein